MKNICYPTHPNSKPTKTTDLFQILIVLKLLHGTRHGCKGSTADDIGLFLVKRFGVDGDIKSQVYKLLKYGVRGKYIYKKKDKYGLITPLSAIHMDPLKCMEEAVEEANCIFPSSWYKTTCNRKEEPCLKIACVKGKKYHKDPYNNPEERCESCKSKAQCSNYFTQQQQQPQRQDNCPCSQRAKDAGDAEDDDFHSSSQDFRDFL